MTKNPFKTLGIDVTAMNDLTDEQLKRIVESQYRSLQQIYHPDHGGDGKISRLLNEAREELSQSKRLKAWRMKSKKTTMTSLKEELEETNDLLEFHQSLILFQYQAMHKQVLAGQYIDLLRIGEKGIKLAKPMTEDQRQIILSGVGDTITNKEDRRQVRHKEHQRLQSKCFLEISVINGKLIKREHDGEKSYMPNRLLVGTVTSDTISEYFGGSYEPIGRFLNSLAVTKGLTKYGEQDSACNISPERFIKLAPYLTMSAEKESYLFSMRLTRNGYVFRLEGKIFWDGVEKKE